MMNSKSVLVLAPHTDDGELGCGGTIAKLAAKGATVHYVAFSICEESVPEPYPKDILAQEVRKATRLLGIEEENLHVQRYPVRRLGEHRQAILEYMVTKKTELRPDIVFVPASDDLHQDHQIIYAEGLRAFKRTTLLGYQLPWNSTSFVGRAFFALEEGHIARKIAALNQYESQSDRAYMQADAVQALAKLRGLQAGCGLAESFEVIRWIWR
jgi:LmbE family N-acetylglucosaminyl deacetylase